MPTRAKKLCSKHGLQPSPCPGCRQAREERVADKKRVRPWYNNADYRMRAKACTDMATLCWLCGGGERIGDPWTADHYHPRSNTTVLLEAHRSCNSRRGNRDAEPDQAWLRLQRYLGDPRLETLGWSVAA